MVLLLIFPSLECSLFLPLITLTYWICMLLSCSLVLLSRNGIVNKWQDYGKLRVRTDEAQPELNNTGPLPTEHGDVMSAETRKQQITMQNEGKIGISVSESQKKRLGCSTPVQSNNGNATITFLDRINRLTVPKSWFVWFYVVGLFWSFSILVSHGSVLTWLVNSFHVCLHPNYYLEGFHRIPIGCFTLHCLKRFLEDYVYIRRQTSSHAESSMHVFGFIIGMTFYCFVPLAFVSFEKQQSKSQDVDVPKLIIGLLLFAYSSYHQLICHHILRKLRRENASYVVPFGDWFVYSSSPHYLAEILIYVSLILIVRSCEQTIPIDLWLALEFTVLNLSITADKTHQWYLNNFGEDYARLNRSRIIPFVF